MVYVDQSGPRNTARRRRQARAIDSVTCKKKQGIVGFGQKGTRTGKCFRRASMSNTSLWPDMIVASVALFVLGEIKSRDGHSTLPTLNVRHTSRGGHGHAYRCGHVHVSHNRDRPRMNWKYSTISWAKDNATKTALQSLCHIVAHEIIHTTELAPRQYKRGRLDRQKMEFFTDNIAADIVSKFSEVERDFWKKYRKARRTQRNAQLRKKRAEDARKTPDAKMERAEANLARWQNELEKSKRHVHKWQVKINRMNGARKAAAKRAANLGGDA